ncbi:MAG TPA: PAS domain-containing protein [Candidatus Eisenbacteria bacterium]
MADAPGAPGHPDPAAIARSLAAIASPSGIDAGLREAARLLGTCSASRVSGVLYVRDGEIAHEAWHPEAEKRHVETMIPLKQAALAAAAGEAPDDRRVTACAVAGDGAATVPEAVVWVRAEDRGSAAGDGRRESPEVERLAQAVLSLLGGKIAAAAEGARYHERQEQYERWFQTLDAQLRILDRERQKFAAVANQPDSYAFVTDGSRTVRWLNKAMAGLLARLGGEGERLGRSCEEVCVRLGLTGRPEGCAACPVMRAYETNEGSHLEVRTGAGDAERDLYVTALPIRGPDGRPIEVLGQIQDVTNLEVVRRAKERLETVISGAPIVLYAVDRDGCFTLSVGKGLEALGLKPGEVIGRSVFEMYGGVPGVEDAIQRALAGETLTRSVLVGDAAFESYFGPLRGPGGEIEGMIGVSTDVTERRRAEEALRRSEEQLRHAQRIEAVGSLAGGVAHDFNNLLTALFGHLKFLRARVAPGSDLEREVDAIQRAADRAASLTRQLLAFSRKQVLQLRAVDMNGVVRDMEPMLRRLIREDVELRIQPEATEAWITADPGQIEQVVMNLAVNARDAMPQGGRLTIRTANVTAGPEGFGEWPGSPGIEPRDPVAAGRYVALMVRDTGTGMDAATQERAFEPFFTTKPVGEGTGLGLSTVYGIVKQSGGEIYLTSAPGSGATFTIYFPCADPAVGSGPGGSASSAASTAAGARAGAPSGEGADAPAPRGVTVLLVEDEQMVRDLFRDVLVDAGFTVLEAGSGDEALAIAARHGEPIDIMVTDVVMPGMGGGELVQRMASAHPEVHVLYVSGYTDDVLVRRGVLDTGIPFLQKPCMPDELVRGVRAALDAPSRPRDATTGTRSSDGGGSGRVRSED